MPRIQIRDANVLPSKPYTLSLSGFLGQNNFDADLEGVNLNIKSAHPLSKKQIRQLEDMLTDAFPHMLDGSYNQIEIDEILVDPPIIFDIR